MGVPSAMPFFLSSLSISDPDHDYDLKLHCICTAQKCHIGCKPPPHRDLGISQKIQKSLAREEKRGEKKKREGKKTPSETG